MKKINETNCIGVWMDHTHAKLIHLNGNIVKIDSEHHGRNAGGSSDGTRLGNFRSTNNEVHKHNREANDLHSYYKDLFDNVKSFEQVIVFGPSTAGAEFHNYVDKNYKNHIGRFAVEKSDYITDNQIVAYVKKYFSINHS